MTKTAGELFNERLNRLKAAIALEKPDRVPVVFLGDAFCARHLGVKFSEFYADQELAHKVILDSVSQLGDIDGLGSTTINPYVFAALWLSNVRFPGKGLEGDLPLQVTEAELMKAEDYDTIINKGWPYFFHDFIENRLEPEVMIKFQEFLEYAPVANRNAAEAGYVVFSPVFMSHPFDVLAGPRSMVPYIKDLYKIPEKVEAALDVVMEDMIENIKRISAFHPLTIFIGGARSSSQFLSPKLWDRFVWKYLYRLVDVIAENGSTAYLHFDGDWSRELPKFRELPKGKFVLGTDGTTDIFRYKDILGDHCCLFGDVPPTLLTLGTPEEVYSYCKKLINEIGPAGFILAAGCGVPYNAKVENVKAMVAAAT